MAAHPRFDQLVRLRMEKTGERFAAARRHVIRQGRTVPVDPAARGHWPGNVPATTALRVLLTHAGVRAPRTGESFSEAMLFGIAGGIGAGVFAFVYEAEDFASFFLAGRHSWQDDLEYLRAACDRLGLTPVVHETAGAKQAAAQLQKALEQGPCAAWVDLCLLPHRGVPATASGSGYHVITIYRVDANAGTALIGDLADEPITIPLADLALARGRIKKQKNRLLSLPAAAGSRDLVGLVREGLRTCQKGLAGGKGKWGTSNFTLEGLRIWSDRMHGTSDKESWERIFTPGRRLWTALTSIHKYIEHYGTGGGLCRPVFADFLAEAALVPGLAALSPLAQRDTELGRAWSALADEALPDDVPALKEAKALLAAKSASILTGHAAEGRTIQARFDRLEAQTAAAFPLTAAQCRELRARLQARIRSLYDDEVTAHAALGEVASAL